jgi:hypothetical protein
LKENLELAQFTPLLGILILSLAEYLLVLRVYLPPVVDDQFYFGCCKYCLLLVGDED